MPRTKVGQGTRGGVNLAALVLALLTIQAASGRVLAQDLLPPPSAQTGVPKPAEPPAAAEELPALTASPPKGDEPPPFPTNPPAAAAPEPKPTKPVAPSAPVEKPAAPVEKPAPPVERLTLPAVPAADPGQPAADHAPAGMKTLPRRAAITPLEGAPRDPETIPAQAPAPAADGANPLPPAVDKPGAKPPAGGEPADGFSLPADRLPVGLQAVGLSIEVVAPPVMNINHPASLKLVVKNTGNTDISTVRVRYELPKELTLVASTPEATRASADDPLLHFMLNTLAAGSERIVTLRVKANAVASIDHAARVYVLAGSRARTVIQQPILKLEMPDPTPSKVLKGQQVQYRIAVKNDGTGPARNVEVVAKFSPGLKVDDNDTVGQTIPIIQPGQRIELDPLIADTFAGGEQTCKVVVTSPDVAVSPTDMSVTRTVVVTKPDLALKLSGPPKRFTDTVADYTLLVENPGTAPARKVTVTAILPASGGRLKSIPAGALWIKETRRLSWEVANLEPGEKTSMVFQVTLGGMGLYQVTAEGRSGELLDKESFSTDVSGFPDIRLEVSERRRVLDVGEFTVFDIKIINMGTKDATNVKLNSFLSANLAPSEYAVEGFQLDTDPPWNEKTGEIRFPTLERLAPNRPVTLSIKAQAKAGGVGTCKVFLEHDDLAGIKMEQFAHTTVTGNEIRTK